MANSADPDQLTDLHLHCLQRKGISGFSRTRVKQKYCSLIIFLLIFSQRTCEEENDIICEVSPLVSYAGEVGLSL